jgi:hypothetical protein
MPNPPLIAFDKISIGVAIRMRIGTAVGRSRTIVHVVFPELSRLVVVVVPIGVLPPGNFISSFVLEHGQLEHLVRCASVLPAELAAVGVVGVEGLRVGSLLLAIADHDVDVVADICGCEDTGIGTLDCMAEKNQLVLFCNILNRHRRNILTVWAGDITCRCTDQCEAFVQRFCCWSSDCQRGTEDDGSDGGILHIE